VVQPPKAPVAMEDKDLVKKIAAIPAEAHLAPKGFFVRKLKPHEISEKKRLKRIDVFKIIRVTCPQGMFEFAIPDKMLVQDLEEKMKEKLYEERLSEAKASTASATKELGDKDEQDKSKVDQKLLGMDNTNIFERRLIPELLKDRLTILS